MKAGETTLQSLLEGTKQYVIPLFQRPYSWGKDQWKTLWEDVMDLYEGEARRTHFIGSVVTMPATSVPEGAAKFLLIDGQQRMTTIFVLLSLLRDKARRNEESTLSEKINNTLLVNNYEKGRDRYKLLPTEVDQQQFMAMVEAKPHMKESAIALAYKFFEKELAKKGIDYERITRVILNDLLIVSIVLDKDDNPHLVFESLNATGKPLTQADLVRNYFLMNVHLDQQKAVYEEYWQPMQAALGDRLTDYMRHFLMKEGGFVRESDIYLSLKDRVTHVNVMSYLHDLEPVWKAFGVRKRGGLCDNTAWYRSCCPALWGRFRLRSAFLWLSTQALSTVRAVL